MPTVHAGMQQALRTLAFSSRAVCRTCRCREVSRSVQTSRAVQAPADQAASMQPDARTISSLTASTSGRGVDNDDAYAGSRPDTQKRLDPGLYLVATPIGNLEDITLRALRVLRCADAVLAEDTRHSRKLLAHYGIATRPTSFHQHNEHGRQEQVLAMLQGGRAVALISDAGMPLVSDPGEGLVRAVAARGIRVFPVPGPSAALAALTASGLPTDRFLFCGFLPPKQGQRAEAIRALAGSTATLIFFVPPHSLARVLVDLAEHLGSNRQCAVARELTKVHEEVYRAPLLEAAQHFAATPPKGEVTLVVAGSDGMEAPTPDDSELEAALAELLAGGCSPSAAAKVLARSLRLPRNAVYATAVRLREAQQQQAGGADTTQGRPADT